MKRMDITKELLTNLPPAQSEVVPPDPRDQMFEDLHSRIDTLQEQVTFLASFESTLLSAFQKEIELLRECASTTQNDTQKKTFSAVSSSLKRIEQRWCDKIDFYVDRKKMSIEVV